MANFLVIVELVDGKVPPSTLEILGQARRVATQLGATVFALLALPQTASESLDEVGVLLGHHGADRVIAATINASDATPPSDLDLHWGTVGAQIVSIIEAVPPRLVLFALTPAGREIAPRLAARLSAGYAYDGWFETRNDALWVGEQGTAFAPDLEFPVVATIGLGRYPLAQSRCAIEVDLLPAQPSPTEFDAVGSSVPMPAAASETLVLGHVALLGQDGAPSGLCRVALDGRNDARANFEVAEPLALVVAALSPAPEGIV